MSDKYHCVRADLVDKGAFGQAIWTDKHSGGLEDGLLWWVQATTQLLQSPE